MSHPRLALALAVALNSICTVGLADTPFVNRDSLLAPSVLVKQAPATSASDRVYSESSDLAPSVAPLPSNAEDLDKVVAVVNDDIITSLQLAQRVAAIRARLQQQDPNALPPEEVLRRQVLQQMILQDVELQIAKRAGIKVDQATLDQAIGNIARANNLTPDQLRQALAQQGQSWTQFEDDLRDRILVDRDRKSVV